MALESSLQSRSRRIVLASSPFEVPPRHLSLKTALANIWFTVRCFIRCIYLGCVFLPVFITVPTYLLVGSFAPHWYRLLLMTVELCGPAFIKLGQWASTRPDVFPADLTQILSKLHDRVQSHPLSQTLEILKASFGDKLSQLHEIGCEVGSGCIAQVHSAKLVIDGQERKVAVKVRHPGVESLIETDLHIMHFFSRIIDAVPSMRWLSLPEEVEEFSRIMREQLDLRVEAENLLQFRANFRGIETVAFPEPFPEWVTSDVLIEEWMEGVSINQFTVGKTSLLKRQLASMGLDSFLQMMLRDNFIHADLHPGNILVQFLDNAGQVSPIDKVDVGKLQAAFKNKLLFPRIIFLDAGLVFSLSPENLQNFVDLLSAIANGNGQLVAKLMVDRSRSDNLNWSKMTTEQKCRDYFGFESKMRVIISRVQKETFRLSNIKIGDILTEIFSLVRAHHVKIESDFTNLVVSIMVIEGLGRQLDPNVDLFEAARPMLRHRQADFYTTRGGLFLKISAFLEARFWLKKTHKNEDYDIIDVLTFRNF